MLLTSSKPVVSRTLASRMAQDYFKRDLPDFYVQVIPALSDNFMYLVVDNATKESAVVDPVNPDKVLEVVEREGTRLTTVLTTHHHWDHAGGNMELVTKHPGLTVCGGDERIGALTKPLKHNNEFKLGTLTVRALATPCHTTGHICYYVGSGNGQSKAVFTGDTLFVGGCGKFFEGTAEQMYTALITVLGSLPKETAVFCGHEYTVNNLLYGQLVEPLNQHIKDKLDWAKELRKKGLPTVPSSIEQEFNFNPFMRVDNLTVQEHAGKVADPISTMAFLREEKNSFKAPPV